jgi:hypothetical protein
MIRSNHPGSVGGRHLATEIDMGPALDFLAAENAKRSVAERMPP